MDFQSWTTPNKLAAFIGISILLLSFYSFFKPEHNFNIMEVEKYKNDTEHFDKWNDLLAKIRRSYEIECRPNLKYLL